jgi:uncharacterized protein
MTAIDPRLPTAAHLVDIFPAPKPIIGTIHLLPLPGAPRYRGEPLATIIERAVDDARAYVEGGIDGLIIENEGDIPFLKPGDIGPETVATLTAVTLAVREAVDVPLGINCLANAVIPSLAVALAAGSAFVRANQWANAYVANEGIVEGAAATAMRFRTYVAATNVRIFADVHVKHGSHAIVADRSIAELTRDTEAFDADVLIATGNRTGHATSVDEVLQIKQAATRPVIVGSGMTPDNTITLMEVADGAIVGSAMKHGGHWENPVSIDNVRAITSQVDRWR